MARKPTRRTTDERGPKTPVSLRASRARSIPLLVLGRASAVVSRTCAALLVLVMSLLGRVGRVAAILGRGLLVVSVRTTAGVLALLVLLVVWWGSVALLVLAVRSGGLAAVLGLAVVLLLLLLGYKLAMCRGRRYGGAWLCQAAHLIVLLIVYMLSRL
jgi:hypothetical protein